jgi:hypothetical protein
MSTKRSVATADHGDLKRRIAELVGSDPSRYGSGCGVERHRGLLSEEVDGICELLGMGLEDEPKSQQMDAVMIRLGRDHRTGAGMWDTADLIAVVEALEAVEGGEA